MEEKELLEQSPAAQGMQVLDETTSEQETIQEQPKEEKQQQESPKLEENIRALREAKLKAERERDDILRYVQEMQQKQQPKEPEEDLDIRLDPEDYAEGKHLLKLTKRMQKIEKDYQDRLANYEKQAAVLAAESQLRVKYPDIDSVINAENIAALREMEPELAASLHVNPDIYSKSVAAYKLIKKLGIHKDTPDLYAQGAASVNAKRPRSSAAIAAQSDDPIQKAYAYGSGLTKEMKDAARRDLEAILKG